jgi:hypothetical protein
LPESVSFTLLLITFLSHLYQCPAGQPILPGIFRFVVRTVYPAPAPAKSLLCFRECITLLLLPYPLRLVCPADYISVIDISLRPQSQNSKDTAGCPFALIISLGFTITLYIFTKACSPRRFMLFSYKNPLSSTTGQVPRLSLWETGFNSLRECQKIKIPASPEKGCVYGGNCPE